MICKFCDAEPRLIIQGKLYYCPECQCYILPKKQPIKEDLYNTKLGEPHTPKDKET